MATTLPRPSRPSLPPPGAAPTSALPALPVSKTRKSLGTGLPSPIAGSPARQSSALEMRSKGLSQNLSSTHLPLANKNASTDSVNSLKALRRTVSIAAFPQPPRTPGSRIASLQGSPLALIGSQTATPSRRGSADDPAHTVKAKKPKTFSMSSSHYSISSNTPSLLNGSGDAKSISGGPGQRGSDGLLSIPSPPQSRSSSAQGSYSTSATTNDDLEGAHLDMDVASDSNRESSDAKGNVLVSVRVKPEPNQDPNREGDWKIDGRKSSIVYRGKEGGDYIYDNVFTAKDDNSRVYERCAKRLVRRTMEGFHSTIFAYGMTSSGKTYSMSGTLSSPGLIPLAITDIFGFIRSTPSREFLLRVSYLEIYNEKIFDLLAASDGSGFASNEEIKLREDSKRGVYATPLKEEIVQSPTQLLRVIARGDQARRTGSTQFNARSSRSHAVVQIVVESRDRIAGALSLEDGRRKLAATPGGVRVSTLSLIDLAGSERAAENKERRQEGAHINRSLLTLGTIISKLSGNKDKDGNPTDKDGKHLPYRDSKLTRLLQGALSGNSLVSILCTVATGSGSTTNTAETLNTLKFGARARNNIVSHAKRAEESLGVGGSDGSRVLLERYRMEILTLRNELESTKKEKTKSEVLEKVKEEEKVEESRHGEQLLEMQLARTALKERIEHLNRLILCSQSTGVNTRSGSSFSIHPRLSGHVSSLSMRSSATQSTINPIRSSNASTIGPLSGGGFEGEDDEEDVLGENGDGKASLSQHVRALQADLADKNRYISTLEKRLLQARRSSHSRMSATFSPPHKLSFIDDGGFAAALKEKDAEIAELRARLDDKERMVSALRSAARKREVADMANDVSQIAAKDKPRRRTVSPPGTSTSATASAALASAGTGVTRQRPLSGRKRTKSVDEMSRMLDEMLQDRVDSGELVKGNRGSLRIAGEKKPTVELKTDVTQALPAAVASIRMPLSPIDLDSLKPPSAPPTMALPLTPPQMAQKNAVLI